MANQGLRLRYEAHLHPVWAVRPRFAAGQWALGSGRELPGNGCDCRTVQYLMSCRSLPRLGNCRPMLPSGFPIACHPPYVSVVLWPSESVWPAELHRSRAGYTGPDGSSEGVGPGSWPPGPDSEPRLGFPAQIRHGSAAPLGDGKTRTHTPRPQTRAAPGEPRTRAIRDGQ